MIKKTQSKSAYILHYNRLQELRNKADSRGQNDNPDDSSGMGELFQGLMLACLGGGYFLKHKLWFWLAVLFWICAMLNFRFEHMGTQGMPSLAMLSMIFT